MSTNANFSAAILVGGKSSRMGSDKAQLIYQNKTFLEHITKALIPLEITLSINPSQKQYKAYKTVIDHNLNIGPISGFKAIMDSTSSEYTLICSCDLPLISQELVSYFIGQASIYQKSVVAVIDGKIMPTFGIYHKDIANIINQQIRNGNYRLTSLLEAIKPHYLEIPSCFAFELQNINTMSDYQKLVSPYVFCVSGFKNSGKTTLVNALITRFKSDEYQVAVIKHDGHDFAVDQTTDTGKFISSQADTVTIYSEHKYQTTNLRQFDFSKHLQSLRDYDVVIIEGMKYSDYPKIVIDNEQTLECSNILFRLNETTRNDIETIYTKILKEMND